MNSHEQQIERDFFVAMRCDEFHWRKYFTEKNYPIIIFSKWIELIPKIIFARFPFLKKNREKKTNDKRLEKESTFFTFFHSCNNWLNLAKSNKSFIVNSQTSTSELLRKHKIPTWNESVYQMCCFWPTKSGKMLRCWSGMLELVNREFDELK